MASVTPPEDGSSEERPGQIDSEDFLAAMADVAPLQGNTQSKITRPKQNADTPGHRQRRDDAVARPRDQADPNFLTLAEVPNVAPLAVLEWRQDGVQEGVFARLRRGGYDLQGELDLHRLTVREAREALFEFVALAIARDWRSVLVSPGKGEHSTTPGRLKSYVAYWLIEHPQVIAYCSAQRQHGGVGSVYAMLKKSREDKEKNRERFGFKSSP